MVGFRQDGEFGSQVCANLLEVCAVFFGGCAEAQRDGRILCVEFLPRVDWVGRDFIHEMRIDIRRVVQDVEQLQDITHHFLTKEHSFTHCITYKPTQRHRCNESQKHVKPTWNQEVGVLSTVSYAP